MPTSAASLRLAAHVRDRRRVVADEHDGEARARCRRALSRATSARHLVAHLLRDRVAVDDRRGHARSVQILGASGRSSVAAATSIRAARIARVQSPIWRWPSASTSSRSRACARCWSEHPERFLARVYTPEEVAFCRGRVPELAARFAAKEAVMKALGTGRARPRLARDRDPAEPPRQAAGLPPRPGEAARRDDRPARRRHQPHARCRPRDRRRRRHRRDRADRPRDASRAPRRVAEGAGTAVKLVTAAQMRDARAGRRRRRHVARRA